MLGTENATPQTDVLLAGPVAQGGALTSSTTGSPERFPPSALVPCPDGRALEPVIVDALAAVPIDQLAAAGAEYNPGESITWIKAGP